MNYHLESILVSSAIELNGGGDQVILDAFKKAMELLIRRDDIFQKIPDDVYISSSSLHDNEKKAGSIVGLAKDRISNNGESIQNTATFYSSDAVLLYDGLHSSAFGSMSYIYRSKGFRIYLFKNECIKVITPYCTIDHHGFAMQNEPWDSWEVPVTDIKSPETLRELFGLLNEDGISSNQPRFICQDILTFLCSIKKPFKKDYLLEYLLPPPDVDKLSMFSQEIKTLLWDLCLSDDFALRWGQNVQNSSMIVLTSAGIPPSSLQLIKFIGEVGKSEPKLDLILERIKQLEDNVVNVVKNSTAPDAINILELKPNFCGVGINVNELYLRLRAWLK